MVAALAVVLAALPGCAATGAAGRAPSTAGTSASGDAVPTDGSDPQTVEASPDARLTVTDVRLSAEEGADRVVLELGGTGTPGWDVRYVDAVTAPGSGEPVRVGGDAVLLVALTGTAYPFDTGVDEFAPTGKLTAAGTRSVTEVHFLATYEGTTTAAVGTRAELPFRVQLLQDPVRVVVEVVHAP
ncbi:hypothetical protein DQ237_05850 [Blastococcus sp. TF02-8]|uniref:AMIN-like domain-containing (lipo)protein n=1 Tax=Blastococcus sp. TF02-8 TaxID=2250574 RepID=UPI000DE8D8E2|nr:hypothetical protein [Blastococcus sp. TF02-8]RBY97104.1 hypothetical protein DQ237_05850 [Blastococcus sp. TF02-8]